MIGDKQLAQLVKRFTEAPSSLYTPEDIAITFGEARIKYQPTATDFDAAGNVDRAVYFKLMLDASTLAAGSLADHRFVINESFNVYAIKAIQEGRLSAVARLVHAERSTYTVEVRLLDAEGHALASGHGTFTLDLNEAFSGSAEPEINEDAPQHLRVAYGSLWRTRFGYVHQN